VFLSVLLFQWNEIAATVAFFLVILIIILDSLDGYIARKYGVASDFGALFDIAGDRIVENVLWIFFAAAGLISVWIPIVVVSRGFLVDLIRTVAYSESGKTPFGKKTMMKSRLGRFLVSSNFSRATYAVSKVFAFGMLGGLLALNKFSAAGVPLVSGSLLKVFEVTVQILVYTALVFCILRGIPVLVDGRHLILVRRFPLRAIGDE